VLVAISDMLQITQNGNAQALNVPHGGPYQRQATSLTEPFSSAVINRFVCHIKDKL